MARDAKFQTGVPLNPAGMNDNAPLESAPSFYQTRGVYSLSEQCLQRCNGKLLITKFSSPVLAIHGGLKDVVFIETADTLYMLDNISDSISDVILGDDGEPVLGDDDLPIVE